MRLIDVPVHCLAMVVKSGQELYGLYGGDWRQSWSLAADLSGQVHVIRKDRPYHTVLGVCPPMYDEIWTGGKVMYKLEQVVADNSRLIIYAPHIAVILASAISPDKCRKINLGYLDPATVNPDDYRNREAEGILFVEKAGEILHRLGS